jgi:kynureninase
LFSVAFRPAPGAAGYQVSGTSVLDLTAVLGSLSIFSKTSMKAIRQKSILLTGYLEYLLLQTPFRADEGSSKLGRPFKIITPHDPAERGAQLSLQMDASLLEGVMHELQVRHIVVDIRKPDVMRIAPAPLFNSFAEIWDFVDAFRNAIKVMGSTKNN